VLLWSRDPLALPKLLLHRKLLVQKALAARRRSLVQGMLRLSRSPLALVKLLVHRKPLLQEPLAPRCSLLLQSMLPLAAPNLLVR
jgi:hypothetical protein